MKERKLLTIFILLGLFGLVTFVSASITDGIIDSTYSWAWGENIGWLNFGWGCPHCNVHITDSAITGYVWNENYGWINLNPSFGGVKNNAEGTLSGYAWGESTGWINFSGVTINSSGVFGGTASGDITGTISFTCNNCGVTTDWRPASTRGGGGLPSGAYSVPAPPFSISINDGATLTNSQIVTLKLNAGIDTKRIAISNFPDFRNAIQEDYQPRKTWDLCQQQEDLCKELETKDKGAELRVFVKFYTQYGQPSEVFSDAIIFDKKAPEIKITQLKDIYSMEEDIILGGISEANSEIILFWNNQYGLVKVDEQGRWLITLGKLPAGQYQILLSSRDKAGNKGEPLIMTIVVEAGVPVTIPPLPIIGRIGEIIKPLIPKIFKPEERKPAPVVTVPEKAPIVLAGEWRILPSKPIEEFVLSPLPKEIKVLAQKFPKLEKTFEEVGITKITDIERLKQTELKLPGLTEAAGFPRLEIEPGKFALPKGVPLAELTSQIKEQIPTEIVFSKTAGGLIDYNIFLTVSEQGKPQQTITTIVGKPLELVVKPDQPVKSIKGYVIFKSKKPKETSFQMPLESFTASLVFSRPDFTQPSEKPTETEEAMVLLEFDYTDPDNDGIYTANIQSPLVDGEYEIVTVMDYQDSKLGAKEIRLITVVDPEGYVYEKDGDKETRIPGAIVSLFWLNPETKQYQLWLAKEYQQENPQTTDIRGTYSFLVPEGYYYLKVEAPGYQIYDGKPFEAKEGGGIHINIELKTKYWWLKLADWRTLMLVVVVLLLLYNFYKDKIRERISRNA